MKERSFILLHPFFLINLFLLLANDTSWKYQYSNWLTGKLSDVSGLIVLAVFLSVFIRIKAVVILICIIFFTWWKSAFSQPVIDFFNVQFNIPVTRVTDVTDLWTIAGLPSIYFIKPKPFIIPFRSMAVKVIALFTLFAFCNTTPVRYNLHSYNRGNEIWMMKTYSSSLNEEQILNRLQRLDIPFYKEYYKWYPVDETHLFHEIRNNDSVKYVSVNNSNDSALYVRRHYPNGFYVIPTYIFNGDTLRYLEFTIDSIKNQKSRVALTSFRISNNEAYAKFMAAKRIRKLKKHFKMIFEKG